MRTHTIPGPTFDSLAGGEGDISGVLADGRRSKRLVQIHETLRRARERQPQLFADAGTAEALAVLVDAQHHAGPAVDDVLLQPHVGAWAARCLRLVAGPAGLRPEDIGHFGAVVAAAAVRSGRPFEVTARPRDGTFMLPTLGLARVEGSHGWCRIRSRPGSRGIEVATGTATIRVPFDVGTRAEARWLPLRRLRSSAAGLEIEFDVDDLDPHRGCGGLRLAPRLGATALEDWQAKLDEAWSLLAREHRASARAIADGVAAVVPLLSSRGVPELSATCHEAVGALAMTPPRDALAFALALVHEFQHTKLAALLDMVRLTTGDSGRRFYAPWRADPRPLNGLLQGAYAYLAITRFWDVHRMSMHNGVRSADELAHFEFAMWRRQVAGVLVGARRSGGLTPEGQRFVDGMARALAQLLRHPVPPRARGLAKLSCIDHALSWRLRNLRPRRDQVARWADAWQSGRSCPPPNRSRSPATVVDGGGAIPSVSRLALMRNRLAGDRPPEPVDGVSPGDHLLLAGEWRAATDAYRRQIVRTPGDLASWAGLAVAHRFLPTPAAWALTTRPEDVLATHRTVVLQSGAAPDPVELASWMAEGGATEVP